MMILRCDLRKQYEAYQPEIDDAIHRVLASGQYTLGPEVAAFEHEFAAYVGVEHAVGVGNATAGLMLALKALEVGPGDEVITTPYTAIPTAAAIAWAGATPVFVDIEPDTFLVDPARLAAAVGPRTKAIMPVHIFGNVADVPRIRAIIGTGIPIIEDAAQSHGSTLQGVRAGSMGDVGVFSFYPSKNLGGYGDGGMVVTNDASLAARLRLLRMYGMTDKDHTVLPGVNSRLDELQAAILRVKLKYLDPMNESRRRIAQRYQSELPERLLVHQMIPQNVVSNFHVYVARVNAGRDALTRFCEQHHIQTNVYYQVPLHLQEAYRGLGYREGDLPLVEQLCRVAIALPLYPELEMKTVDYIIETIHSFANVAIGTTNLGSWRATG